MPGLDIPGRHRPPAPQCKSHSIYLLSCDDYDRLVERAGGRCELCRVDPLDTPHRLLHIDHDPFVGQGAVRGLLCSRCNTRLGRRLVPPDLAEPYLAAPLFQLATRSTIRKEPRRG